ncbi:hypothetical protein RRG08_046968 [Elysia crispata]|uniref:Uncharacterized protein n=1 Tax=Elysia crispata TaxID=231223 RepID=A0AAE1A8F5_9GAST|nr:hypothetical protein RRG08_046968 [Elysia crispata]
MRGQVDLMTAIMGPSGHGISVTISPHRAEHCDSGHAMHCPQPTVLRHESGDRNMSCSYLYGSCVTEAMVQDKLALRAPIFLHYSTINIITEPFTCCRVFPTVHGTACRSTHDAAPTRQCRVSSAAALDLLGRLRHTVQA